MASKGMFIAQNVRVRQYELMKRLVSSHPSPSQCKACRANPEVRKRVAAAIINAITNNDVAKAADIPTPNVVVRFSEA